MTAAPAPRKGFRAWRQRVSRHPAVRLCLHPAITLAGLLALVVLIFWGTIYQANHGLYEAQRMFFGYVIWAGGVFPLPGTSVILWVLCLQVALTMAVSMPLVWRKAGLWIVHGGLLLLLVGGFVTQVMAVESQLTLAEGETGHFTTAYHDWEAAVWQSHGDTNTVLAYGDESLREDAVLDLAPYPARLTVERYYPNATAFGPMATGGQLPYLNASGVASIEPRPGEKDAGQNAPGLIATLRENGGRERHILLYGLEPRPLALTLGDQRVFLQLRRKHYPLGFSLKLTDFVRTLHPGTDIAKSYESYADLQDGLSSRPVKIYMNNPLRYKGYTLFQASFSEDQQGEHSTFAVVTNPGRVLPYVSSLMVFGGMLIHFLLGFLGYVRRTARK